MNHMDELTQIKHQKEINFQGKKYKIEKSNLSIAKTKKKTFINLYLELV